MAVSRPCRDSAASLRAYGFQGAAKVLKRKAAQGAFVLLVLPSLLLSAGLRRRHFTGAECMAISRRLPQRLTASLCRQFMNYYAQLADDEAVFFAVSHLINKIYGNPVDLSVEYGPKNLFDEICETSDRVIFTSVHYAILPILDLVLGKMPHKTLALISGGPDNIRRYMTGKFGEVGERAHVVKNDKGCLRRLADFACADSIVIASCDRPSRKGGVCDQIKGGIFAYASRTGTKLVGPSIELREDGVVSVDLAWIDTSGTVAEAMDQFIALQKPTRVFVPESLEPAA